MNINKTRIQRYLQQFDFESLFIEELGWDNFDTNLNLMVDGTSIALQAIAEKRGMVLFQHQAAGEIPPAPLRNKIELLVAKNYREHFIIFTDSAHTEQKWFWVKRELGRPLARRTHTFNPQQQSGDSLVQKLEALAFSFAEEEDLTLIDVTNRVRAAFNVERATKKFYDQFKKERGAFEKFVLGIPDVDMSKWYVSVMLNRLMFVYFIQRKGFLDGDTDYLRSRMQIMQQQHGGDQFYSFYRYFLLRLFHEGLGEPDHDLELERLIGKVPYLNGGIFQLHEVEQKYPDIQISDEAFTRIFDFFDQYQWHLDDRPLRDDKEINPDVLGYIFEKYINQKQMGAYYTKEDITEYISKNTILPFLFDAAVPELAGFQNLSALWQADPDRYIYAAVRKGTELPLPAEIALGLDDASQRGEWNTRTPDEYALPTEIWRETVARRQRYEEVRGKLVAGEVNSINDFITYNLDIQQLAQDVIENCEGPELLRAFWKALNRVSVLDPTCGSGAFLFAALNILQPLYEACLERMEAFVEELQSPRPEGFAKPFGSQKYSDFKQVLAQVAQHPNQTYYVLKSIVVNNLYGVDIMAEAVEIAKLRLFLKLVAQVETEDQIEPLPDIDFNIRAGNTLVGFTSKEEIRKAMQDKQLSTGVQQARMVFGEDETALTTIEEKAGDVDRLFSRFREMQTSGDLHDFDAADFVETKKQLNMRLRDLEAELNQYLALQYGVNPDKKEAYLKWLASHQPFHWFVEFYGILKEGGFNVIVGNPPYVEYKKIIGEYSIQWFDTENCGNLYAFVMERSKKLLINSGRTGLIVPISLTSAQRMKPLQKTLFENNEFLWLSNFGLRPAALFPGVMQRLTIVLEKSGSRVSPFTTDYITWYAKERPTLFETLSFIKLKGIVQDYSIPKVNNIVAHSALEKVFNQGRYWQNHRQFKGNYITYYHNAGGYWIKTFDSKPYYRSLVNPNKKHTTISELKMQTYELSITYLAILNSSLFYFFWKSLTDARHVYPSDIAMLPIQLPLPQNLLDKLLPLTKRLMSCYRINSSRIIYGKSEVDQYKISPCKEILDEVDKLFAQHYGFTDEELDFIINYDIKYRMGNDLFADEDEEGD